MKKTVFILIVFIMMINLLPGAQCETASEDMIILGFDMPFEELMPQLLQLHLEQSEWTEKTAPQTLDEFGFIPNGMFELGEALDKKIKAKNSHKGKIYTCVSNIKDLFDEAGVKTEQYTSTVVFFTSTQKNGGMYSTPVYESEPYTYTVDYTDNEDFKDLKIGTGIECQKTWDTGYDGWECGFNAIKGITDQNIGYWNQTATFSISKDQYVFWWGINAKKHTLLFDIRDIDEYQGLIMIFNTKTGKRTFFQRGGNILITTK